MNAVRSVGPVAERLSCLGALDYAPRFDLELTLKDRKALDRAALMAVGVENASRFL